VKKDEIGRVCSKGTEEASDVYILAATTENEMPSLDLSIYRKIILKWI
jgi:hypothetical protein